MDETTITTYLRRIAEARYENESEIGGWRSQVVDYVSPGNLVPQSDWRPFTGLEVFPPGSSVLMETQWTFPPVIRRSGDKQDYLLIRVDDLEGLLSLDGTPFHGVDANRERIPIPQELAGRKVQLSLELYNRKRAAVLREKPMLLYSRWLTVDRRIDALYFDLLLAWESLPHVASEFIRKGLAAAIEQALRFLDVSLDRESFPAAAVAAAATLREGIGRIGRGDPHGSIALVAHTHIDTAWLWQLKETIRKCGRSFSNVVRLMEEYPDFSFACSQAQLYEYTRDHYPALYARIKELVREGRWEIVSPLWVESDCNLVPGESMVRQLLHGSRFFQAEFGRKSEICWLPDTFGFPGSLPQILARSGVRYFYTYKLHWQNVNRFPYGMFRWRGIDGSEVLAEVPRIESGYNAKLKPSELRHAQDDNLQKGVADDLLLSYGYGDGGGGPTREMMEYGARLEGFPGMPDCRRTSALGFFKDAEKLRGNLPVWTGELYLETHRGTYTSQAMVKKMNRRCEQLLREAEIFGVIAGLCGKSVDWQAIHAAWKQVLLLQFHDILPGSSIREVYEDARVQYDEIVTAGERSLRESLEVIAGPEEGITVFNSLSWERGDVVRIPLPAGPGREDRGQLREVDGAPVAFVVSETGHGPEMVFTAERVPSMGLKRYRIGPSPAKGSEEGTPTSRILAAQGGVSLETQRYAIDLRTDGAISRLYDRKAGREVVPKGQRANAIHLFLDGPQQEDSWNLYPEYKAREIDPGWKSTITVLENNPVRTVVRVTRHAEKVILTQDIVLYARLDRIDFVTSVDWRERHKIMRVSFPVEVLSPRATFEVGFGAVERPTYANNPWERAMFEVCGQRWVDLSEAEYGVSLLNDSKYGCDVADGTISLTLLRGTNYPDPGADLGAHEFTYALYPHEGDWSKALAPRRGCELNAPLRAIRSNGGAGSAKDSAMGTVFGAFGVDRAHVLLDTVKPAEDGRGIILRLYESCGSRGPVRVTTPFRIAHITECNLMEEEEHPARAEERAFGFAIRPFEIRTFRVVPAV